MERGRIERTIVLTTGLEVIPDDITCILCGGPVERRFVEMELAIDSIRVRLPHTAGYVCPKDELEYVSDEALMEAYQAMEVIARETGQGRTVEVIQEHLRTQKKIMEKFGRGKAGK
ncbi:hypothetical protein M1116_03965 [Patescibacteria group bacterium]|nr:hypothetical protein [Patescibacteria group bacterium]